MQTRLLAVAVTCMIGWAGYASGEVIGVGGTANTSAEPTTANGGVLISGWNNVGQVGVGTPNGASGVYLGNGWVLTANHVGALAFTLNGVNYAATGVKEQLSTPSSYTGGASGDHNSDVLLYQINTAPGGLPGSLTLAATSPSAGTPVVSIGYGYTNQSGGTLSYFDSNWQSTTQANATYAGYYENNYGTKTWGNNFTSLYQGASELNYVDSSSGTQTIGFQAEYYTDGTSQGVGDTEEQLLGLGDSGGAVFNNSGQLIGMNDAYIPLTGEPSSVYYTNAVFGEYSVFADLPAYYNQIQYYTALPEPAAVGFSMCGFLAAALRRTRRPAASF